MGQWSSARNTICECGVDEMIMHMLLGCPICEGENGLGRGSNTGYTCRKWDTLLEGNVKKVTEFLLGLTPILLENLWFPDLRIR